MDPPGTDADVDSKRATRGVKKGIWIRINAVDWSGALRIGVTRDAAGVRKYKTLRNSRFGRRASKKQFWIGQNASGNLDSFYIWRRRNFCTNFSPSTLCACRPRSRSPFRRSEHQVWSCDFWVMVIDDTTYLAMHVCTLAIMYACFCSNLSISRSLLRINLPRYLMCVAKTGRTSNVTLQSLPLLLLLIVLALYHYHYYYYRYFYHTR